MNQRLLDDPRVYPKIIVWWGPCNGETELNLFDKTLKQAYNTAINFGYRPPVWYKPWQYLTGGLGVLTVG
jgi:hypothetical protein